MLNLKPTPSEAIFLVLMVTAALAVIASRIPDWVVVGARSIVRFAIEASL